jgi:protein kinase C substrate 80K-H
VDEFADHGAEDESGYASKIEGSPVSKVEKVKKSAFVHIYYSWKVVLHCLGSLVTVKNITCHSLLIQHEGQEDEEPVTTKIKDESTLVPETGHDAGNEVSHAQPMEEVSPTPHPTPS